MLCRHLGHLDVGLPHETDTLPNCALRRLRLNWNFMTMCNRMMPQEPVSVLVKSYRQ
jgi:hypothetical protein